VSGGSGQFDDATMNTAKIVGLAARYQLPAMYFQPQYVVNGGWFLMPQNQRTSGVALLCMWTRS
jgi:hypothetical protein